MSLAAFLGIGCTPKTSKIEQSEDQAYQIFKAKAHDGKAFGAKFDPKSAIPYDALVSKIEKGDKTENVTVTGKVEAVCKAKGCWMNIQSETGKPSMFVKFQDYAFFMPKDLAGKKIVMTGKAFTETTPVEQLKHFAEDEGKSPTEIAKITKPKTEMKFMATGVVIVD
ncbi:MAG: hypothetical protein RL329_687 [Bacteroidota bacterium]|jgi:hypothetical protein